MAYDQTCIWPHDAEPCTGTTEIRGLCHRHYMRAVRTGILGTFPAAEFFGDIDTRRINDRSDVRTCSCDIPRRGDLDGCERCGRLIADVARIADLRARYVQDRTGRWIAKAR